MTTITIEKLKDLMWQLRDNHIINVFVNEYSTSEIVEVDGHTYMAGLYKIHTFGITRDYASKFELLSVRHNAHPQSKNDKFSVKELKTRLAIEGFNVVSLDVDTRTIEASQKIK